MNNSANRVVAIATPLVFAPLAGAVTALAAKHAPGLDIDQGQLEAIFIAGATIAVAKAGLWLKGWQDYEKRQDAMHAAALTSADDPYADGDEYLGDDIEDELDADVDGEIEDRFDGDFDAEIEDEFDADFEDEESDDLPVAQKR